MDTGSSEQDAIHPGKGELWTEFQRWAWFKQEDGGEHPPQTLCPPATYQTAFGDDLM